MGEKKVITLPPLEAYIKVDLFMLTILTESQHNTS